MKKSFITLFILLASKGFLLCQVTEKSLKEDAVHLQYSSLFSAEENWKIQKEAYIKQLKAKGFTNDEIKKKLIEYETLKKDFIQKINEQRELAIIQQQKANELRKLADEQRRKAEELRSLADEQRLKAEELRKQAELLREEAEVREKEREQQFKKADEIFRQADAQFQKADVLFKEVDLQFEEADSLFEKAEKQRNKINAPEKKFEKLLTKEIILSNGSNNSKIITVEHNRETSLRFTIDGKINAGTVLIELINPGGKKEAELSLIHEKDQRSGNSEKSVKFTSGSLNKIIAKARKGAWQIKITDNKSQGSINISVDQALKSGINE